MDGVLAVYVHDLIPMQVRMFNWALVLSLCMLAITIMDNRARGSGMTILNYSM